MVIYFKDVRSRTVAGDAIVTYDDGSVERKHNIGRYGLDPEIAGKRPIEGHFSPQGSHWISVLDQFEHPHTHICIESSPFERNWWRELVGRGTPQPNAGLGVTLGVIDTPFLPTGGLSHVLCVDVEGNRVSHEPDDSHGRRVAQILLGRSELGLLEGIAPGANAIAVDVSSPSQSLEVNFDKIAPAIEMLALQHSANIINISAGADAKFLGANYPGQTAILEEAIDAAYARGSIVLAATGNTPQSSDVLPASIRKVIGVGSIAQGGVAPPGSLMHHVEEASRQKRLVGRFGSKPIFVDPSMPPGRGMTVVAPGVGIFASDASDQFSESWGTSFACSIVSGVLACALAADDEYRAKKGHARSTHAVRKLRMICSDLGLPKSLQGWGLPNLNHCAL